MFSMSHRVDSTATDFMQFPTFDCCCGSVRLRSKPNDPGDMMGMWMRSLVSVDDITVRRTKSRELLQSANGSIRWISFNSVAPEKPSFDWNTTPVECEAFIQVDNPYMGWRSWGGRRRWIVRFVAYWLVTIPLTLLSAYLILWKPRKRMGAEHA